MNTKRVLIDVGSSTVKIYRQDSGLMLIATKSISFKKNLTPEAGIAESDKEELILLVNAIKKKNPTSTIKIYATAAFRKLTSNQKKSFIDEFYTRTGLYFNIISQELENFYLEIALVGKYHTNEPVLLVNIGGGSTELVVIHNNQTIEKLNVDMGIANILDKFPRINDEISSHELAEVLDYALSRLPEMRSKPKKAFYGGGELRYMQLTKYPLEKNDLFDDEDHPSIVKTSGFKLKNEWLFKEATLKKLESLMPTDPKWMHGARGCSALAQAVFVKYGVDTIIPSNSNLIDGVVRQEFRTVTLSGSFRKHLPYIFKLRSELVKNNIEVLNPRFIKPKNPGEEFVIFSGEEGTSPLQLERFHLESIEKSDALIVCDPQGYVGASTLFEIGYAHAIGKRVIFTEKPEEFLLQNLPAEYSL